MAYTITFRKKTKGHFKRIRRKNWDAVVNWIQNHGEGCSMIHIRDLEQYEGVLV